MPDLLFILALGFFLGMRHATDADHVVAVTTILARQRDVWAAAATGLLWGVGHTLTVMAVGSAIIVFKLSIPYLVGVGMELSVGIMLVVLGALNVAALSNLQPFFWRRGVRTAFGDADLDAHDHGYARPVVVGVVHGLAGSAAVTLLVVAAVGDPRWAISYLLVFGLGTISGMTLVTMSLASALRLAGGQSETASRRLGLACGVASIVFGLSFAYQIWSSASLPLGP